MSNQLMGIVFGAKLAHKATGASLCGPNLSTYPAWLYDAFCVIEGAINAAESAMF
jgi:hypothetical protein